MIKQRISYYILTMNPTVFLSVAMELMVIFNIATKEADLPP